MEQPTRSSFFHVPLHLKPITIALLFSHSFIPSLGSNNCVITEELKEQKYHSSGEKNLGFLKLDIGEALY